MKSISSRKLTYLEQVSIAAREPIYSATLGWIFGDNSPLKAEQRRNIINNLFDCDIPHEAEIHAETEWNKIDILLTAKHKEKLIYIAIENKIKAEENFCQLKKYDKTIAKKLGKNNNMEIHKAIITVIDGNLPPNCEWKSVTYSDVLKHVFLYRHQSVYIRDFCRSVCRLIKAGKSATEESLVAFAFGDKDASKCHPIATYVADMRLEKLVQRIWMRKLSEKLVEKKSLEEGWSIYIGETHGRALLNIQSTSENKSVNRGYTVGIQIQNHSVKAFCHPDPDKAKESHRHADEVKKYLSFIKKGFINEITKDASKQITKGFRSFNIGTMPNCRNLECWSRKLTSPVGKLYKIFCSHKYPASDG